MGLPLAKHEYFMPKQIFAFFLFTISNNTSICISDFIFDVININFFNGVGVMSTPILFILHFLYKTDNCKTDDYINPSMSL